MQVWRNICVDLCCRSMYCLPEHTRALHYYTWLLSWFHSVVVSLCFVACFFSVVLAAVYWEAGWSLLSLELLCFALHSPECLHAKQYTSGTVSYLSSSTETQAWTASTFACLALLILPRICFWVQQASTQCNTYGMFWAKVDIFSTEKVNISCITLCNICDKLGTFSIILSFTLWMRWERLHFTWPTHSEQEQEQKQPLCFRLEPILFRSNHQRLLAYNFGIYQGCVYFPFACVQDR